MRETNGILDLSAGTILDAPLLFLFSDLPSDQPPDFTERIREG